MSASARFPLSELASGAARRVDVGGVAVAVVRIDDDVYAIGDVCSHADVSLSTGEVWCDELEIECPKHGSAFSLETGEPNTLPATQPVLVHHAFLVGGDGVPVARLDQRAGVGVRGVQQNGGPLEPGRLADAFADALGQLLGKAERVRSDEHGPFAVLARERNRLRPQIRRDRFRWLRPRRISSHSDGLLRRDLRLRQPDLPFGPGRQHDNRRQQRQQNLPEHHLPPRSSCFS